MENLFNKYNLYITSRNEYEEEYDNYLSYCNKEELEKEMVFLKRKENSRKLDIDRRKKLISKGWDGSLSRRFKWSNVSYYGTK